MYDHHKLGRELGLFDTDPLIGSGLPYWLPDGAIVRHTLEEYIRAAEQRAGYQHVYSPVLAKRELYEISGHWAHYRDDMYPPMRLGSEQIVLRPSLCPHHAVIYRSRARSYRELPLRLAEIGGQYRAELSGVLGGLTRVRAMQLNDAHIFCGLDQVADEASAALDMIRAAYAALGVQPARYRLSLPGAGEQVRRRPGPLAPGGGPARQRARRPVACPMNGPPGRRRSTGRRSTCRSPTGPAGRPACRPSRSTSICRPGSTCATSGRTGPGTARSCCTAASSAAWSAPSPTSSTSHGGAFPAWLAPVQLVILPVSAAELDQAGALRRRAVDQGLRAQVSDPGHGSLGARIRAARLVPYQAVIGAREAAAGQVALRLRDGRRRDARPAAEVLAQIGALVAAHRADLWEKDID